MPSYERITADDIAPGDYVARTRTAAFQRVRTVKPSAVAVRLTYVDTSDDRPRRTAKWWRLHAPQAFVTVPRMAKVAGNWTATAERNIIGMFADVTAAADYIKRNGWLREPRVETF